MCAVTTIDTCANALLLLVLRTIGVCMPTTGARVCCVLRTAWRRAAHSSRGPSSVLVWGCQLARHQGVWTRRMQCHTQQVAQKVHVQLHTQRACLLHLSIPLHLCGMHCCVDGGVASYMRVASCKAARASILQCNLVLQPLLSTAFVCTVCGLDDPRGHQCVRVDVCVCVCGCKYGLICQPTVCARAI